MSECAELAFCINDAIRTYSESISAKIEETEMTDNSVAQIGNEGRYTVFRIGDQRLKFIAPYSLEHYIRVKKWDNGYIVVDAKYSHSDEPVEEYIDLIPILDNLMINKETFLSSIRSVEVAQ